MLIKRLQLPFSKRRIFAWDRVVRFMCIYGLGQLNGLIEKATSMLQASFLLLVKLQRVWGGHAIAIYAPLLWR